MAVLPQSGDPPFLGAAFSRSPLASPRATRIHIHQAKPTAVTPNHHVKTNRELRSLRAVLQEWVRLNRLLGLQWSRYTRDLPWWYNERALLSVFAGAIWRTGGNAFEEFSDLKHKGKRQPKGHGRVDIWFETSGNEFRGEAKNAEIPITKEAKQLDRLHALMRRAVADARSNPADGGKSRRLAITFATPYLKATIPKEQHRDKILRFLSLAKTVDHDAIAWVFPRLKSLPIFDGWVCPGILVLIKRV
jgi:hypothetical protein